MKKIIDFLKKLLQPLQDLYPKKYHERILKHVPVGMVCSLLVLAHPVISVMFGAGFLVYEVSENRDIHDLAYPDIAGFLWGVAIAGVVIRIVT